MMIRPRRTFALLMLLLYLYARLQLLKRRPALQIQVALTSEIGSRK